MFLRAVNGIASVLTMLSTKVKTFLSTAAATGAGIVAALVVKDEPQLIALVPASVQVIVAGVLFAVAHRLTAWGVKEQARLDAVSKASQ